MSYSTTNMDDRNQSQIVWWLTIIIIVAVIGVVSTNNANKTLQKQVAELQVQTSSYNDCINYYQVNENKLITAIADAKRNLDEAQNLNDYDLYLPEAVNALHNVDTTHTSCVIPEAPNVPTPTALY